MSLKMTSSGTKKFLDLYEKERCLWDLEHEEYRSNIHKKAALDRIITAMGMKGVSRNDVKIKIKNLRSTYRLELRKIEKSIEENPDNMYKPKLCWFEQMHRFIRNVPVKGKRISPFVSNESYSISSQKYFEDDEHMEEAEEESDGDAKNFFERSPSPPPTAASPQLLDYAPSETHHIEVESREKTSFVDVGECAPNEFEVFGNHVATQLRILSEEQSIVAQEQIQAVLTKCRLNDLNNTVI